VRLTTDEERNQITQIGLCKVSTGM